MPRAACLRNPLWMKDSITLLEPSFLSRVSRINLILAIGQPSASMPTLVQNACRFACKSACRFACRFSRLSTTKCTKMRHSRSFFLPRASRFCLKNNAEIRLIRLNFSEFLLRGANGHLYFYCRILLIVNDSSRNEKVKMYTFNTPLSQSSLRFVLQRYNENAESPNLLTYILSWSYISNT